MKKKLFNLMALLMVTSMLLTACGSSAKPVAMPKELNVWITWGDNPQQLQALFDKFGQANNVKVIVTAPVDQDNILPALTG